MVEQTWLDLAVVDLDLNFVDVDWFVVLVTHKIEASASRTLVLAIREKECRLPAGHWLVFAINLALLNLVEEDELERAIGSKKGFHLACTSAVE